MLAGDERGGKRARLADLPQLLLRNVDVNLQQAQQKVQQQQQPAAGTPVVPPASTPIAAPSSPPDTDEAPVAAPPAAAAGPAAADAAPAIATQLLPVRPAAGFYGLGTAASTETPAGRASVWLCALSARASAPRPLLSAGHPAQALAFAAGDAAEAEEASSARARGRRERRVAYFSREAGGDAGGGRRTFGCASAGELYLLLLATPPGERHFYELLREGRPVQPYLDVDVDLRRFPGADGPAAVAALRRLLPASAAWAAAGLPPLEGEGSVVELDSSTVNKFSRHLILRPPNAALVDTAAAGRLVRAFLAEAAAAASAGCPAAAALFLHGGCGPDAGAAGGGGGSCCVVDAGVYTRNRAFRTALSSKFGKGAVLLPVDAAAAAAALPSQSQPAALSRALFLASLVAEVAPGASLLDCAACATGAPALAPPPLPAVAGGAQPAPQAALRMQQPQPPRPLARTGAPGEPCPLPAVAAAVLAAAEARGGGPAALRSWAVAGAPQLLLLLSLSRNRFCARVGRPHRSNGVFWVVSLAPAPAGAGGGCCWAHQRCHDVDCAGFRSPSVPLPPDAAREVAAWAARNAPRPAQQQQPPSLLAVAGASGAGCGDEDDEWWRSLSERGLAALEAAARGA